MEFRNNIDFNKTPREIIQQNNNGFKSAAIAFIDEQKTSIMNLELICEDINGKRSSQTISSIHHDKTAEWLKEIDLLAAQQRTLDEKLKVLREKKPPKEKPEIPEQKETDTKIPIEVTMKDWKLINVPFGTICGQCGTLKMTSCYKYTGFSFTDNYICRSCASKFTIHNPPPINK